MDIYIKNKCVPALLSTTIMYIDLVPTTIMSLSVKGGPNDGNLTFPQFYEKFFFNYIILILR